MVQYYETEKQLLNFETWCGLCEHFRIPRGWYLDSIKNKYRQFENDYHARKCNFYKQFLPNKRRFNIIFVVVENTRTHIPILEQNKILDIEYIYIYFFLFPN